MDNDGHHKFHIDPFLDSPDKSSPSSLEYEVDPLLRLERDRTSNRHAVAFAVAVPAITVLTAFIVAIISRTIGGPLCTAGVSNWICSRTFEILFPVIPGLISFSGTLLGAWLTYRIWGRFGQWQPWLATLWVLVLFTMFWIVGTGTMLIIGQD